MNDARLTLGIKEGKNILIELPNRYTRLFWYNKLMELERGSKGE